MKSTIKQLACAAVISLASVGASAPANALYEYDWSSLGNTYARTQAMVLFQGNGLYVANCAQYGECGFHSWLRSWRNFFGMSD